MSKKLRWSKLTSQLIENKNCKWHVAIDWGERIFFFSNVVWKVCQLELQICCIQLSSGIVDRNFVSFSFEAKWARMFIEGENLC